MWYGWSCSIHIVTVFYFHPVQVCVYHKACARVGSCCLRSSVAAIVTCVPKCRVAALYVHIETSAGAYAVRFVCLCYSTYDSNPPPLPPQLHTKMHSIIQCILVHTRRPDFCQDIIQCPERLPSTSCTMRLGR